MCFIKFVFTFLDTLTVRPQDSDKNVPVLRTGIAWTSDKEIKFRNPPGDLKTGKVLFIYLCYTFSGKIYVFKL